MYVLFPHLGALLNIDRTIKHCRPKETCFDVSGDLKSIFVEQDKLVRALIDVEFLCSIYFAMSSKCDSASWSRIT